MTPRFALAHATGFCAGVWDPVVDVLGSDRIRRWSFVGHGGRPRPSEPLNWWRFGEQALAETETGMVGVGHSMGGAALVMAELLDPGHFDALFLIEPIVFPWIDPRIVEGMAEQASRRRSQFASVSEARRLFERKDVFSAWHPAAMEGYLRDGLVANDSGVQLACQPDFEAEVYRTYFDRALWDRLGEVTCPVLVMAGSDSDTYAPGYADHLAGRFKDARSEVVRDAGHFVPMERPELIASTARSLDRPRSE